MQAERKIGTLSSSLYLNHITHCFPELPNTQMFNFETVTIDSIGEIIFTQAGQSKCIVERLSGSVFLELAFVPSGSILMGSSEPKAYLQELPVHSIEVEVFAIGKYTVTQEQWKAVSELPSIHRKLGKMPSSGGGKAHPVSKVSWEDAVEFCRRLSKLTSFTYRLPSEAEWEYACRAKTLTAYHFGDAITSDLANYDGNYSSNPKIKGIFRNKTTPISSFKYTNAFGLSDMHGNVWEWCQDWWHENYDSAPTDGSSWNSNGDSTYRVIRGGSLSNDALSCRSAYRQKGTMSYKSCNTGFRVVREISKTI